MIFPGRQQIWLRRSRNWLCRKFHIPCVLLCDNVMFAGDTLFAGSCGRTDLPGGSWQEILRSLKKLSGLPGDYTVIPGHGPKTTLDFERRTNPYMGAL